MTRRRKNWRGPWPPPGWESFAHDGETAYRTHSPWGEVTCYPDGTRWVLVTPAFINEKYRSAHEAVSKAIIWLRQKRASSC